MRFFRSLIDFLYPPGCIICHTRTSEAHGLCPSCWAKLSLIDKPYCERLGVPLPSGYEGVLVSPEAIASPPDFLRARSVCHYDETARQVVRKFKYGDRPEMAQLMGRMMTTAGKELLEGCDLVVPIPLHRLRLWQRRYNQAALLADVIASHAQKPSAPLLLTRTRYTKTQTSLSRNQRHATLRGAFAVSQDWLPRLSGLKIVLIDDVLTSGATANSAARALTKAGALSVDVLTFARVVKE